MLFFSATHARDNITHASTTYIVFSCRILLVKCEISEKCTLRVFIYSIHTRALFPGTEILNAHLDLSTLGSRTGLDFFPCERWKSLWRTTYAKLFQLLRVLYCNDFLCNCIRQISSVSFVEFYLLIVRGISREFIYYLKTTEFTYLLPPF